MVVRFRRRRWCCCYCFCQWFILWRQILGVDGGLNAFGPNASLLQDTTVFKALVCTARFTLIVRITQSNQAPYFLHLSMFHQCRVRELPTMTKGLGGGGGGGAVISVSVGIYGWLGGRA